MEPDNDSGGLKIAKQKVLSEQIKAFYPGNGFMNIKVFFTVFLVLSGLLRSATISTRNEVGTQIILQPDDDCDVTKIQVIMDKRPWQGQWIRLAIADLYFNQLAARLAGFEGSIDLKPTQFMPGQPYNWLETRVLSFSALPSELSDQWAAFWRVISKHRIDRGDDEAFIMLQQMQMAADAPLNNVRGIPQNLARGITDITESEMRAILPVDQIQSQLSIFISGRFETLDVLEDANSQKSAAAEKSVLAEPTGTVRIINKQNRVIVRNNRITIHYKVPPVTIEGHIARAFVMYHTREFFNIHWPQAEIRGYIPWNTEPALISLMVERDGIGNDFNMDGFIEWMARIHLRLDDMLSRWYYAQYIPKLTARFFDYDSRLTAQNLSRLYFGDTGHRLFRVYVKKRLPLKTIEKDIEQWIKRARFILEKP